MKSKLGVPLLIVFLALIFTWIYKAVTSTPLSPSRMTGRTEISKSTSLRSILKSPITTLRSEMGRVSPQCREFEDAVLGLSLNVFEYPPSIDHLPSPEGCSPDQPRVAKILRYYSEQCAEAFKKLPDPSLPKKEWGEKLGECQFAFLITRSTLADSARGIRPISEMNDLRELADLLTAEFGSLFTGMSPEAAERIRAAADRMLEIDPRLFSAIKAGAMATLIDSIMKGEARAKGNQDAPIPNWDDLEKRIARIEEADPNDSDLDAFRRFVNTKGMDPERVREDSISRLSGTPGDAHEQETLAWANWRLGRTDEARATLAEARRLNPKDPEIRANWEAIHRPGAKPDDFKIAMKIGVNLTDLLKE